MSAHQPWQGEDAPEECIVCEKPWPCADALDEARAELGRIREQGNVLILDAENGAQLTNWNYYGSPNEASQPFLDQEVVDFYAATLEANTEVIEDTGDYEINFTDYFAAAKS